MSIFLISRLITSNALIMVAVLTIKAYPAAALEISLTVQATSVSEAN